MSTMSQVHNYSAKTIDGPPSRAVASSGAKYTLVLCSILPHDDFSRFCKKKLPLPRIYGGFLGVACLFCAPIDASEASGARLHQCPKNRRAIRFEYIGDCLHGGGVVLTSPSLSEGISSGGCLLRFVCSVRTCKMELCEVNFLVWDVIFSVSTSICLLLRAFLRP